MRTYFMLIVGLFLLSFGLVQSTENIITPVKAKKSAFKGGEKLKYRIHYGLITAGKAELNVKHKKTDSGSQVYHVIGTGRTVGMTDLFFRTRDTYESYIDAESMFPIEFIRDINEGGYITKRHIYFDQKNKTANDVLFNKDSIFQLENRMHDLFSAFYYARSLNAKGLKVGDQIPINIFLDHEPFEFRLKYMGKETIKTKFGKIRCLKFMPVVQKGRVFKDEESATLWITDDDNKIPILLKSDLFIGSIKMDLIEYKNTAAPLRFK